MKDDNSPILYLKYVKKELANDTLCAIVSII